MDDTLLSGNKGKEVPQMLILEVGSIEGPEWRVDIEIAVEGNGKVGVIGASGHVTKFLEEGESVWRQCA